MAEKKASAKTSTTKAPKAPKAAKAAAKPASSANAPSAPAAPSQYEAMFLLGPSATADLDGAIALCRSMIERHQGKVLVIKKWDERKLAYEVNGQKRGTYII